MAADSPTTTVAVGAALLLVGYLVRERGWHFLVAGLNSDAVAFPEWTGDVVGTYTAVVGLATVALGLLALWGSAPSWLWSIYGGAVAGSALTLPFWAPRYVQWRLGRAANE